VPVEVVVLLETDADELTVELAEVEVEICVQLGRVIVPLPQPPEPQITSQLFHLLARIRISKRSSSSLLGASSITRCIG
jgi:hypothetical protein